MNFFNSLILFLLVLGSSSIEIYMAMKRNEKKVICIQIGILGLTIAGGIFAIYRSVDPSIARVLGAVIPRMN